jgi:hypothetical protein
MQKKSVRMMATITGGGKVMKKRVLKRSRIRAIQGGFAFIPHRFLSDGFIKRLGPGELLLYLFLILVADACGLSYYGDPAICRMLKMSRCQLEHCRQILIDEDLIAFEAPLYQVLELPIRPGQKTVAENSVRSSSSSSFSELLDSLGD